MFDNFYNKRWVHIISNLIMMFVHILSEYILYLDVQALLEFRGLCVKQKSREKRTANLIHDNKLGASSK